MGSVSFSVPEAKGLIKGPMYLSTAMEATSATEPPATAATEPVAPSVAPVITTSGNVFTVNPTNYFSDVKWKDNMNLEMLMVDTEYK